MSPEIHIDTFEDADADRGDHLPTCRRVVTQVLFDQPRGVSGEEDAQWECGPMCRAEQGEG